MIEWARLIANDSAKKMGVSSASEKDWDRMGRWRLLEENMAIPAPALCPRTEPSVKRTN